MHLGKAAQKRRLKKLEKDKVSRWRVTKEQWKHWRMYDKFIAAAEQALRQTSTVDSPWMIVEGDDEAYRSITVATMIRDAVGKAQRRRPRRAPTRPPQVVGGGAVAGQLSAKPAAARHRRGDRVGIMPR